MMAPSPVDPALIHNYHMHVYYDPNSRIALGSCERG
jgi:aromatic ring-cleaving dioxygenase